MSEQGTEREQLDREDAEAWAEDDAAHRECCQPLDT